MLCYVFFIHKSTYHSKLNIVLLFRKHLKLSFRIVLLANFRCLHIQKLGQNPHRGARVGRGLTKPYLVVIIWRTKNRDFSRRRPALQYSNPVLTPLCNPYFYFLQRSYSINTNVRPSVCMYVCMSICLSVFMSDLGGNVIFSASK